VLANVSRVYATKCVAGIEADVERCRAHAERTAALATALNPLIGYERAAGIVHRAQAEERSIIDVVIDEGVLDADEARRVLDPALLAKPGE
jgi:aspartate ammonia-lyase